MAKLSGLNLLIDEMNEKLCSHLSSELNVDVSTVQQAMKSYGKKKVEQKAPESNHTCAQVFMRGDNKGNECGKKAGFEVENKYYCATHAKALKSSLARKQLKDDFVKPKTKVEAKKKSDSTSSTLVRDLLNQTIQHVKLNEFGNHEHVQTHIVFDMNTVSVIGSQHKNGKIVPLTAKQIDTCEVHNWVISPSATASVQKDSDDEDVQIEEDAQSEVQIDEVEDNEVDGAQSVESNTEGQTEGQTDDEFDFDDI